MDFMGRESTATMRMNAEVGLVIQTHFATTLRDLICARANLISMVTGFRALLRTGLLWDLKLP